MIFDSFLTFLFLLFYSVASSKSWKQCPQTKQTLFWIRPWPLDLQTDAQTKESFHWKQQLQVFCWPLCCDGALNLRPAAVDSLERGRMVSGFFVWQIFPSKYLMCWWSGLIRAVVCSFISCLSEVRTRQSPAEPLGIELCSWHTPTQICSNTDWKVSFIKRERETLVLSILKGNSTK